MSHQVQRSEKMQIEHPVVRRNINTNKSIRLCPEAIVANFNEEQEIKKIHIDMLPTEHRRLVGNTTVGNPKEHLEKIHRFFLNSLFMRQTIHLTFPISGEYIDKLLEAMEKAVEEEPTLVRVILTSCRSDCRSRSSEISTARSQS